ncbi:Maf family protein [Cognatilysobacter bugurensis]|uniref:dTTP/UTP pyrophosphatase n=1 Tax=Cognatilysobacter bugurensis TaxID=543356 RepID=A0A918SYY2_9GAMM|nr:Maf family nucleotide pyrophosphatase [Lysobacter bugurensis]GHA75619.1 Maf-like protein [Lysobacter bugurensis]
MLYLASKSPRRRELLARLGVEFEVLDIDVPEVRGEAEPVFDYVRRVANEKAGAGLGLAGEGLVIGSDTEVALGGRVFGKPRDAHDAHEMLTELSGRTHHVITAVTLVGRGSPAQALSVSEVTFAPLDDMQIARYVEMGEFAGKAGAYAIQGAAEAFIRRLTGSYSGVMGLPLYETAQLLGAAGLGPHAAVPDA